MKVGEMYISEDLKGEIQNELESVLEKINWSLKSATLQGEERALLLNAKANTLLALQKYE